MFSGIVQHCGKLTKIDLENNTTRLWIEADFESLELGESIALDGCCITVADIQNHYFACDISPETSKCTIAKEYKVGQSINLERSLRFMDRCSGHWVLGHVDETIIIKSIISHDQCYEFIFTNVSQQHSSYLIKKGSVAINGISLTLNRVSAEEFSVMVIPHTWNVTGLKNAKAGQAVNVEYDYLAKIVAHQIGMGRENIFKEVQHEIR